MTKTFYNKQRFRKLTKTFGNIRSKGHAFMTCKIHEQVIRDHLSRLLNYHFKSFWKEFAKNKEFFPVFEGNKTLIYLVSSAVSICCLHKLY